MSNPKYSFVLSAYKAEFLKEAIKSILSQTYRDFELIIVNDASPYDLYSIVASFRDDRITYYKNKTNEGGKSLVNQWNKCIEYAKGTYTIMASDDDLYDSKFLENVDVLVDKYPHVNVLRGRVVRIDKKNEEIDWEFHLNEWLSQEDFCLFWSKGIIDCLANYIYRTSVLKKRGFVDFPHAHYSDVATSFSMADKGIVNCKDAYFYFRTSEVNLSNSSNKKVVMCQIQATMSFFSWLTDFVERYGKNKKKKECVIFFCKNQYKRMLINLYKKMPFPIFFFHIPKILNDKYLYRKERILMLLSRFIG